jgi:hypothetical protein
MKLHANAALSLNRGRLLCRRVLEEGWSPRQGGQDCGGVGLTRFRGHLTLWDRLVRKGDKCVKPGASARR